MLNLQYNGYMQSAYYDDIDTIKYYILYEKDTMKVHSWALYSKLPIDHYFHSNSAFFIHV